MAEHSKEKKKSSHLSIQIVLNPKKDTELIRYLDQQTLAAREFYNSCMFLERQLYFMKTRPTDGWPISLWEIILNADKLYDLKGKSIRFNDYNSLEAYATLFIKTEHSAWLQAKTRQQIERKVVSDFHTWFKAKTAYREHPERFKKKPGMPGYKKTERTSVYFSNQQVQIRDGEITFPEKKSYACSWIPKDFQSLKSIQVEPYYDTYKLNLSYLSARRETQNSRESPAEEKVFKPAGMDLGLNVAAALVTTDHARVYNGRPLKSELQFYNKQIAHLQRELDLYRNSIQDPEMKSALKRTTKRLQKLYRKKRGVVNNFLHQVSRKIIEDCREWDITHLVIGKNPGWKDKVRMGVVNNQNFVYFPMARFIEILTYKAEMAGIEVILTEESYTSKCNHYKNDFLPVFDPQNPKRYHFSGQRYRRGLYQIEKGNTIHADLNGGVGILRKVYPEVWIPLETVKKADGYTFRTRIVQTEK